MMMAPTDLHLWYNRPQKKKEKRKINRTDSSFLTGCVSAHVRVTRKTQLKDKLGVGILKEEPPSCGGGATNWKVLRLRLILDRLRWREERNV